MDFVHDIHSYDTITPLESIHLDQIDSAFERCPVLHDLPLAIVLHKDEYVEIDTK